MGPTKDEVTTALGRIDLPGGGTLAASGLVRALAVAGGTVRFVIEAPDARAAEGLGSVRDRAEAAVRALAGVESVSVVLTAPAPPPGQRAAPPRTPPSGAPSGPPSLTIGRHPTPNSGPQRIAGVDRIIAIGSGKGGVGKSTVATNLAVALAREGRRVGLLDADIYGPSLPRMMGLEGQRPSSPDGTIIEPLHAHGVTAMSIGLMVDPAKAVVWRGPMLMGALQQMLTQVAWGQLDVLLVDLPPGTGDVQLTLCQRTHLTGAIVVSTPQDVALIDARKAIDMFRTLNTTILGLVENMSTFVCPRCGEETQLFGHGGVAREAEAMGVPLLAELPIDLATRLGGDAGRPVALDPGAASEPWLRLSRRLVDGGMG